MHAIWCSLPEYKWWVAEPVFKIHESHAFIELHWVAGSLEIVQDHACTGVMKVVLCCEIASWNAGISHHKELLRGH